MPKRQKYIQKSFSFENEISEMETFIEDNSKKRGTKLGALAASLSYSATTTTAAFAGLSTNVERKIEVDLEFIL